MIKHLYHIFIVFCLLSCGEKEKGFLSDNYSKVRVLNSELQSIDYEAKLLLYQINSNELFYVWTEEIDTSNYYYGYEINLALSDVEFLKNELVCFSYTPTDIDKNLLFNKGLAKLTVFFSKSGEIVTIGRGGTMSGVDGAELTLLKLKNEYSVFENFLKNNQSRLSPELKKVAEYNNLF